MEVKVKGVIVGVLVIMVVWDGKINICLMRFGYCFVDSV